MGVLRFELSGVESQGYYYPEIRGKEGRKLDLFTADPITRALGKKLIDFFGGKVTINEPGKMETKEKVLLTNNSPFLDIDPSWLSY